MTGKVRETRKELSPALFYTRKGVTMPTFFYSRETEALRRSLQRPVTPSVGMPSDVFVVKTDGGDEIHIPAGVLGKFATIVVTTPPCGQEGYIIVVLIVNRNADEESAGILIKDGLSAGIGHVTAGEAKRYAKPAIENATQLARERITDRVSTRVAGKASMGISGYLARKVGGIAAGQLTGLAVKAAATKAVSIITSGPASLVALAISAGSTGYQMRIAGRTVGGVPVEIHITGTKP